MVLHKSRCIQTNEQTDKRSTNEINNQPIFRARSEVNQPINESINQSVSCSINPSTGQSVHPIHQHQSREDNDSGKKIILGRWKHWKKQKKTFNPVLTFQHHNWTLSVVVFSLFLSIPISHSVTSLSHMPKFMILRATPLYRYSAVPSPRRWQAVRCFDPPASFRSLLLVFCSDYLL